MVATGPLLLASLGLAVHAAPTPPPDRSAPEPVGCIAIALSPDELKAEIQPTITCYPSYAESLGAIGIEVDPYASPAELLDAASLSSSVLATHYNTSYGTGTFITDNCNGGGLSLVGTGYDNLFSSTRHGLCGTIKHWDNGNLTGDEETTSGGPGHLVPLSPLSNRVSSISYH